MSKTTNILLLLTGVLVFIGIINNFVYTHTCVENTKVIDILSLEGRSATIKLDNGSTVSIYQGNLKKGDNYCFSYEKKLRNDFF